MMFEERYDDDDDNSDEGSNDYRERDDCGSNILLFGDVVKNYHTLDRSVDDDYDKQQRYCNNNNNNNTNGDANSESLQLLDKRRETGRVASETTVDAQQQSSDITTKRQQHLQQTRSLPHVFRWRVPKLPENTIDYHNTGDGKLEVRDRVAEILLKYRVLYIEKQRQRFTTDC